MGKSRKNDRFASYGADDELVSLVAEGLPAWPDANDLTERTAEGEYAIADADLGTMHDAYVEEARGLVAAGEGEANPRIAELTERIPALRDEAARRLSEVGGSGDGDAGSGGGEGAGTDEGSGDGEGAGDGSGGEGDGGEGGGEGAGTDEGADELAALRSVLEAGHGTGVDPAALMAQLRGMDPAAVATATAEGIGRALNPLVERMEAALTASGGTGTIPARPTRVTAAQLAEYNGAEGGPAAGPERRARGRLVYAGDSRQGQANGSDITEMGQLVRAFQERGRLMGSPVMSDDERMLIAQVIPDEPSELRDFRGMRDASSEGIREKIRRVVGPDAMGVNPWNLNEELPIGRGGIAVEDPGSLVASGGLAAPVEPYYAQLLLAEADRPVAGAMPGMTAERGGIRLVLPPSLGTLTAATTPGYFTDGVTNTDTSLVSATAAFTAGDVGSPVVETDGLGAIPAGTIIASVTNGTTVVLSQATVHTLTGVAFKIANRNPYNLGGPVGVVTAAQDAAGPPSVVKYTYDVPLGTQAEHDVYSVYTSLQFANLTARTFPEQVEVNIRLAAALAARTADTQMLNYITGWSTLVTAAKTFGTARQLLAQFEHMAAYYRNFNRMDPAAVLRLGIPAWAINAMRADYISTFIGGGDNWGLSDDELAAWFEDRHVLPFFYWDGPSDISQLFATIGSGAINTGGVNSATPVALPDYPGSGATTSFRTKVVSFMWAEGTWLNLTTGELNLGLVRDSILNSQNRFRNFEEVWETPAFVGLQSLRCVHTVASDGTYGAAASITLGAGSGL